jgi:hypothetical protein
MCETVATLAGVIPGFMPRLSGSRLRTFSPPQRGGVRGGEKQRALLLPRHPTPPATGVAGDPPRQGEGGRSVRRASSTMTFSLVTLRSIVSCRPTALSLQRPNVTTRYNCRVRTGPDSSGLIPGTHRAANPNACVAALPPTRIICARGVMSPGHKARDDKEEVRRRTTLDNPLEPVGRWVPSTSAGMTT